MIYAKMILICGGAPEQVCMQHHAKSWHILIVVCLGSVSQIHSTLDCNRQSRQTLVLTARPAGFLRWEIWGILLEHPEEELQGYWVGSWLADIQSRRYPTTSLVAYY